MNKYYIFLVAIFISACNKRSQRNENDFILEYAENLISDVKGKTISCIENLQVKNN
jgi:hypothetical protein